MDRQGEVLNLVQEMRGLCEAKDGTEIDDLLQAGASRHKRARQDVKTNSGPRKEDGRIPAKKARDRKIEGQQSRITWKEYKRLLNEFEIEGFIAQKGFWNLARQKRLQDRGAWPKEEGDVIREYKAMHEKNVLSSWLRKDGEDKKGRSMETERETKENMCTKRTREEEREENETGSAKRRCVGFISAEASDIFSQGEDLESCGNSWSDFWDESCGLSDCDSVTWTRLIVVNDVFVSPSSAMGDMCEGVSLDSDGEVVEPQSFFFHPKALVCLCGKSMRDELRRVASKSASEHQKKDDAAYATANCAFFDGGKPVASGSGGTTEYLEYSGKKGNCGNGGVPGRKRRYESGHQGVGAAVGSRRLRSLSEVYPDGCKKEEQQVFRFFQHKREN